MASCVLDKRQRSKKRSIGRMMAFYTEDLKLGRNKKWGFKTHCNKPKKKKTHTHTAACSSVSPPKLESKNAAPKIRLF